MDQKLEVSINFRLLSPQDQLSGHRNSFMGDDIFSIVEDKEIIEIDSVFISKSLRRKGIGTKLVKEIIGQYPEHIICCSSGCLVKEYPDEPSQEEINMINQSLEKFITQIGFVNINNLVGYENKEAYVYNNLKARPIIERSKNISNKNTI